MLIAGALSVIAGATYLPPALGDAPSLSMLIPYTAAGGVFFAMPGREPGMAAAPAGRPGLIDTSAVAAGRSMRPATTSSLPLMGVWLVTRMKQGAMMLHARLPIAVLP